MIDFSRQFVVACFLVFIAVWIVTAFSAKRTVERAGFPWVGVAVVAGFVVFAIHRLNIGRAQAGGGIIWDSAPLPALIGDALTLAGLLIMLWARFTLGGNWSAQVEFKENHELIERGPYAYVRHPIYSGAVLMVLGAAILSGRIVPFEVLVLLVIAFVFKSGQEEALLTKHFPEAYPKYKARVKAFIPSVF
jgi:protein-S-isoprenylcysteine O-methyltransferase Ste14